MKTKKRSKILSLLLVLMMLLTMVPITAVTANAADDTSYPQAEIRNYYTFATYLRSFNSRDLKLMEDINYTVDIKDVSIDVIRNQKLDLNGHKITINASRRSGFENLLCIRRGEFTLYDSKGGGELAVSFPDDDKAYSIIMMSSEKEDEPSKFTMNGGTLTKLSPNMTYSYGASGCIGDDYFNKPENGKRSQITINSGTINCAYNWDRSKSLLSLPVEAMPLALQLLYSNLTINGGTFNGIVWTDLLTLGEGETEPRVVLNGGVFNSPFVVEDMSRTATQMVIDGAHFKDGFHVDNRYSQNTDVGTVPQLLLKSGVFDSPDNNPKLDIYNVTAAHGDSTIVKNRVILHAMKCFPNSAIKVNGTIYTSENINSLVRSNDKGYYLNFNSSTPIEVIRDAWGMKSVTLDGTEINYAKDWKGEVERMDNSTAHTLKFEWNSLARELVSAGYSYRAKCEHYISGSSAVQQTDTIAADKTSHTVTIPAGADPKVYSFDLQLNLEKNGSSVGIMSNEHIVKLVVNEAPVVTEISSAPVQLSAALMPGNSAPSATAVGSGYTVDSINWYTDNSCTNPASSFVAEKNYYGKIVLKPEKNYKFAASASAVPFCDDPNENYSIVGSYTVAADGSSLTLVVKGTAVSALRWESVDKTNQTYTIGNSALMLNAKAVGGDSSKPITYKLIAEKGGTETIKASATVAASSTEGFSAPLRFTETGTYRCWFEATRGGVTISSEVFEVTVSAPGLSITNQSGDLTVKQNATARLFVKAVGHGVNYQWQVKNGETWEAISGATAYDYAAPTTEVGEKTYRCKVTDSYSETRYSDEMKVTVIAGTDPNLTPAIPLAAVNGDAPDPAKLWPGKDVTPNGWLGLEAEYHVTAGETFQGVATFSTIPTGFTMNGHDIYYDSHSQIQKTPVLGTISYEWKGTKENPWSASSSDFTPLGTDAHASFTMPTEAGTYYVVQSVTNTIGEGYGNQATSTVYITFHVSEAHTHTYAYAQLNESNHTKYCTACDESTTENHTMENGVCKFCGYAPAKTYSVTVTNGSADHSTNVTPGTKVTLTANKAPDGKVFDKWEVVSGSITLADATSATTTFTMPAGAVSVKATYKAALHTPTMPKSIKSGGVTYTKNSAGEYVGKKAKKPSIKKLKKGKKAFKITWKKVSGVSGYQVQYSTSKKFTKKTSKKITYKGNKKFTKTVKKLKGGKKYYVRVRTYKTVKVNGKTVKLYSSWSKAKTVTTKK